MTEWMQLAVSALVGLATAIPLVVKLIEYVKKAIMERNWGKVLDMVMEYMKVAEEMFDNGADRKQWVLAMVEASADTINYEINISSISALIDSLCDMSKVVNAPEETKGGSEM